MKLELQPRKVFCIRCPLWRESMRQSKRCPERYVYMLRVFRHACPKSFKILPHTRRFYLRKWPRVIYFCSENSSRVRQTLSLDSCDYAFVDADVSDFTPLLCLFFVPETTARSAIPGVSPGRGLLIPHGYLHPGKCEHSEVQSSSMILGASLWFMGGPPH